MGFLPGRIIRCMASATPAPRPAEQAPDVPVHAEPAAAVWERTGSRPEGLTAEEVASRRGAAPARTGRSRAGDVLEEVVESLTEPLMLLLIAVAVLSAIFGELRDAIAIFFVIVLIGAVEAIAEVRAKRALRALRDLSAPNALVRRAGAAEAVPVGAVVVGDVLLVEAGSVVAARRARRRGRRPGRGRGAADGRARVGGQGTRAGRRRRAARRALVAAACRDRGRRRRRRGRRRGARRRHGDRASRAARRGGQGAADAAAARDGRAGARGARSSPWRRACSCRSSACSAASRRARCCWTG